MLYCGHSLRESICPPQTGHLYLECTVIRSASWFPPFFSHNLCRGENHSYFFFPKQCLHMVTAGSRNKQDGRNHILFTANRWTCKLINWWKCSKQVVKEPGNVCGWAACRWAGHSHGPIPHTRLGGPEGGVRGREKGSRELFSLAAHLLRSQTSHTPAALPSRPCGWSLIYSTSHTTKPTPCLWPLPEYLLGTVPSWKTK